MISNKFDDSNHSKTQEIDLNMTRKLKYFNSKPSIDFYLMNYYDMHIMNNTSLMISQYKNLHSSSAINDLQYKESISYIHKGIRGVYYLSTSFFLIKKFQSLLIVPIFFSNVKFGKFLLDNFVKKRNESICNHCYFCQQRKRYQINCIKYSIYSELIQENSMSIIN